MKRIVYKLSIACLSALLLTASGCNDKLVEEPRSLLTPSYFSTPEGIQAGVVAAYSGMRFQYGPEGAMNISVLGTDEFTAGQESGSRDINGYQAGLNSGNGQFTTQWNRIFTFINTCNGVIDLGPNAQLDAGTRDRLIAEAKYLRAHNYFLLVQSFGDVPLDLGAGKLRFNTTPNTASTRSPMSEVYEVMIQDLTEAIPALPNTRPSGTHRVSKATAMHLLAKIYLTRAGTSAKQASDYSNAFNTAKELIDNSGTYGLALLQDFADVHREGNEYSSEIIFAVERNNNVNFLENGDESGLKENRSIYLFTPLYEGVRIGDNKIPLVRSLEYARPWQRYRPTEWLLNGAFGERVNDSRYDKTFRTVWLANNPNASQRPEGMAIGDTAVWMPGRELTPAEIASKPYLVIPPSKYTGTMYPHMRKYDDSRRPNVNDPSIRPYIVHKFSETYLIAAEAALMDGRPAEAVPYINAVRRRAAYRATNTPAQNAAAAAAMEVTEADITLDFILDERSRELAGESMRWYDLVRTGKLLERVRLYNPEGAPNIQPHHMLRPIPQGQIDLTTNEFPQNPGY